MRRIWFGLMWASALWLFAPGCGSDKKSSNGASGSGGSAGSAGSTSTGGAGSSAGGSSSNAGSPGTDGGSAGADGGSTGADGGSAGAADGGSAGTSAGDGGSAGSGGDAGAGGQGGDDECSPAADDCPAGSYCTADNTCAPGCKNGTDCASGVCGASHDCERCLGDTECAAGRQCATGVCNSPCSENDPGSCGGGRTCCGTRCVDTTHDIGHCLACGTSCTAQEFCGTTGCLSAIVANVCNVARATALLDGQPADDASSAAALAALDAGCDPALMTQAVNQTIAEQINTQTGQVVTSGGELLVFAGGPFFNTGINYLEAQRTTPVYSGGVFPQIGFYRTSDNSPIITSTISESTDSHDIIVVQVGREPITGTPSLILYGFNEYGTRAAVWQFENGLLPDLATFTEAYYVYEWTDADADHAGDAGEFVLIDSGP